MPRRLHLKVGRWPKTDKELWEMVTTVWGRYIPRIRVCPNHQSPFEAFAHAFFSRAPVTIWKASRGFGGKSTLLATLANTELVCQGADVRVLGGSGAQSLRVHEEMSEGWLRPRAPKKLLRDDPLKQSIKLRNKGRAVALLASQTQVRGPHPQRLRLDEIDEMKLPILDAAMGQPMRSRGISAQTVMSSTHHHPDGTMTEVLKRAAEKGWPVFTWCYRECLEPHGWLSPADVEQKKQEVTALQWDTEYELQEPSVEGRALLPEAVEAMFHVELGEHDGQEGEYLEFEAPEPFVYYATGADWARKVHQTVILTFRTDAMPWRLVAFERMHDRGWPHMIDRLNKRVARYPGAAGHDALGVGDVVSGFLTEPVKDVMMSGRVRQDIFTEYVVAIERGEIIAPRIQFMYNGHKYCRNQELYGSGTQNHPPDDVVAGAIAWHMRDEIPAQDYGPQAHGERTVRPNP